MMLGRLPPSRVRVAPCACWLRVAYVDDERFDALIVLVILVGRALVALVLVATPVEVRQLGLDAIANLDDGEVRRGL